MTVFRPAGLVDVLHGARQCWLRSIPVAVVERRRTAPATSARSRRSDVHRDRQAPVGARLADAVGEPLVGVPLQVAVDRRVDVAPGHHLRARCCRPSGCGRRCWGRPRTCSRRRCRSASCRTPARGRRRPCPSALTKPIRFAASLPPGYVRRLYLLGEDSRSVVLAAPRAPPWRSRPGRRGRGRRTGSWCVRSLSMVSK